MFTMTSEVNTTSIERNISNVPEALPFIDSTDCCASVYHLHYHYQHYHLVNDTANNFTARVLELFNEFVQKQDTEVSTVKNFFSSVNTTGDITLIILSLYIIVSVLFMLFILYQHYIGTYHRHLVTWCASRK